MKDKRERIHDALVHQIYCKPDLIIPDSNLIIQKSLEVGLYQNGRLIVTPDLYFQTSRGEYYFEIKSVNNKHTKRKGRDQMERIFSVLGNTAIIGLVYPEHGRGGIDRLIRELYNPYSR